MDRRSFLRRASALTAAGAATRLVPGCGNAAPGTPGAIAHLLPTASHDRLLIKASFAFPLDAPPMLAVGRRRITGRPTGTRGRHFAFDLDGLEPDVRYELALKLGSESLGEPWELATLPAPDAPRERVRLLAYTCAGGHDFLGYWLTAAVRRRLLRRGLAFTPDAVIANGDHVYWDLVFGTTAAGMGQRPDAIEAFGAFDRTASVLGTDNEAVLDAIVAPQIADVYGDLLRSTPVYFLRDDHDYFENDYFFDATAETPARASFPPDRFSQDAARATQNLFYPEFLPDPTRPLTLPGAGAPDRPAGIGESFGTFRFGSLLELLLYDCKGHLSTNGAAAGLVPATVERWLTERTRRSEARHVVHAPSNPPGWTAGKWAEWYPDVLIARNELSIDRPKPGWQNGWLHQHDRLLDVLAQSQRIPLAMSGDLHDHALGRIVRSATRDFTGNPVNTVVTGPLGTGPGGWPSRGIRQTPAMPPLQLTVETTLAPLEQNGFSLIDVEPERIVVRTFVWNAEQDPEEAIDTLEPARIDVLEPVRA